MFPFIWMTTFDDNCFSLWKTKERVRVQRSFWECAGNHSTNLLFSGRTRTATFTEAIINQHQTEHIQLSLLPVCPLRLWKTKSIFLATASAWISMQRASHLIITPGACFIDALNVTALGRDKESINKLYHKQKSIINWCPFVIQPWDDKSAYL